MHVCAACFSPHTDYTAHDRLVGRHKDDDEDPRIPFTEAGDTPSGSLQLGINTKGTPDRAHLFTDDLRAVGCRWKVSAGRING